MTLVTRQKDLMHILANLEQKLPETVMVYSMTKNLLEGRFAQYKLWVDKLPDCSAVIVVSDERPCLTYYKQQVFIHGDGPEALSTLIDNPNIINWNAKFVLNGLTKQTREIIGRYLSNYHGYTFVPIQPDILYTASDVNELVDLPIPDNVRIGRMSLEAADRANSLGLYVGEDSYEYFRDLVNEKQISVCLYHPVTNRPLGWAIQHMNGELGNLHVEEECRRRGYGKYIMSALAKEAIHKNGHAFVFVESDNYISQILQEKVGLKRILNNGFIWQRYRMESQSDLINNS